jgi:hypothetical protein
MKGQVRVILLGLAGLAALASAGDQAVPQAPPAPAVPAVPAATPAPGPPPAGDIEDFVASEKVGADDAVAFPVDI